MTKKVLKFNTASEVINHLEQEELSDKERAYYFNELRNSGGMQGISYNKEK